jgi:hypothetical protein
MNSTDVKRATYLLALVSFASACSGRNTESASANAGDGGALGMGGSATAVAGNIGAAATGAASSASGGGGKSECVTARDCPVPASPCRSATCSAGVCGAAAAAEGTFIRRGMPADCFDTVCDLRGGETKQVDINNVPDSATSCVSTRCDASGALSSEPVAAGADCTTKAGGTRCDGMGNCVPCLDASDCAPTQACSAMHECVTPSCTDCGGPSCSDGKLDGTETDVDCGGSCSPCALTKDCYADSDCASRACDEYTPRRCLSSHCLDHRMDGDETSNDCGGSCPACGDGGFCKVNADCQSGKCDASRGNICMAARCLNGKLDGTETDLDCGGGICDGCALGKKCEATWDCETRACDVLSRTCIADHCTDHAHDGDETDVDCGGPTCTKCPLYRRCIANSDCAAPHTCTLTMPHVCE